MIKIFDKDNYESVYAIYYLDNSIKYYTKNSECECFLVNRDLHLCIYNFSLDVIDIISNHDPNYNYYLYI